MSRWLIVLASMLLSGCAVIVPATSPIVTPTHVPSPLKPLGTTPQEQNPVVRRAIDDLAKRLQIDPAQIQVGAIGADEFPAQGLGCAFSTPVGTAGDQPALITGLSITLQVGNTSYQYRNHGQELVYCGVLNN